MPEFITIWKDGLYQYQEEEPARYQEDYHDFLLNIPVSEVLAQITAVPEKTHKEMHLSRPDFFAVARGKHDDFSFIDSGNWSDEKREFIVRHKSGCYRGTLYKSDDGVYLTTGILHPVVKVKKLVEVWE